MVCQLMYNLVIPLLFLNLYLKLFLSTGQKLIYLELSLYTVRNVAQEYIQKNNVQASAQPIYMLD